VTPSARSLLADLDKLPFPARNRLLARIARDEAGTPALDGLLADLAGGDAFSRRTALQLAAVAAHANTVVRLLDPGDVGLVTRAIGVAVRLRVGDEALCALEPNLPPAVRSVLYRACRRHGRTDLAERLLPAVRARWGDRDAAALLTVCRGETVRAVLPELEYAVTSWTALARRHPQVVLDFVEAQLTALPRAAWAELWHRVGPGAAVLAPDAPGRVLGLLELSNHRCGIPPTLHASMATLARHDPQRVLRLVLDPRRPGGTPAGRRFWRAFAEASDADLVALARTVTGHQLACFLATMPPRRRSAIYRGLLAGGDLVSAGLHFSVLDVLPAADRHAEAARVLALPTVADDAVLRLAVTARLDWDAARPALAQAIRRPTADERAAAYPLFIACARASRDPETVGSMLASLDRVANEQDPVRVAALTAVAAIPTWLFREADAGTLRKLMADAMEARDKSWQTNTVVGELARALVREGAISRRPELISAGLSGLELLSRHITYPGLHGLNRDLPRGTERLVLDVIYPRLSADAKTGRYGAALEFAEGLGRRAWPLADLQALVNRARSATDDGIVRRAVTLWLAPTDTRDTRVEQVLRDDRSTITIPAVQAALSYRRTDLLDDIFRRPLHGRFLKRNVRHVPTFRGCFDAWLPRQVDAYAQLLMGVATAPGAPVHQVVSAVHTLGRVPGSLDEVRLFLGDSEVPVQEAALAALAWSDDPAAVLPDLLAHIGGDRARVAVYALTRCARFVPPDQLGDALRPVLAGAKVTVRKEAVRLLAAHRVAEAPHLLGEAWARPEQHRDVRRAVAAATRYLLDHEGSWDLLRAAGADPATATAVLEIAPGEIAVGLRARFADVVAFVAESSDPDIARAGLAAMPRWAQWSGRSGLEVTVRHVVDLAGTSTWRVAIDALIAGCDALDDPEAVLAAAEGLIERLGAEFADRDQPALQRLLELARRLQHRLAGPDGLHPAAVRLADRIAQLAPASAIALAAAALRWEDEAALLAEVHHIAGLAGGPLLASAAGAGVAGNLSRVLTRIDSLRLQRLARALIDAGTLATVMIGLEIIRVAGPPAGWREPWRSWLHELRAHADPDVRTVATGTFTAPE
jgi:hypothetical protein